MAGTTAAVLYAVAKELAQRAKDSLPNLREGETIKREWLHDGVYYRETDLNGQTFMGQYDFRSGEICFLAAG